MAKVKLTVQYIPNCPLKDEMIKRVEKAIEQLDDPVSFDKMEIKTEEDADRVAFRGSPTLLINGADFEGIPPPRMPLPNLRIYRKGIPTTEMIVQRIRQEFLK